MGYVPLIDDRSYQYGRLADFFVQSRLDCDPGADWANRSRTKLGQGDWEAADHVKMSRDGGMYVPDLSLLSPPLTHPSHIARHNFFDKWFTSDRYYSRGQRQGIALIDRGAIYNGRRLSFLPADLSFGSGMRLPIQLTIS